MRAPTARLTRLLTEQDGVVPQRTTWWAITLDCTEPRRVADFWSGVLDCEVIEPGPDREGWFRLEPLGSRGPFMNFQPVSEPKVGKVRIHLDVLVDDLGAAVERVVALGGVDTGAREELPRGRIAVMRDPETNEFCLLAPPAQASPGSWKTAPMDADDQPPGRSGRMSADERRDRLLDVAAELLVTQSPESVTMEVVAERCGVSRPLVYKHFANRDELLGALYRREARRLDAAMASQVAAAATVEEMFGALVRGALRAAGEHAHLFTVLRAAGGSSRELRREQRARDDRTFRAFARRAVEDLGLDPRLGPTAVSLLLSLIDPVLAQWRQEPTPERAVLLEEAYLAIVAATLSDIAARPPTT